MKFIMTLAFVASTIFHASKAHAYAIAVPILSTTGVAICATGPADSGINDLGCITAGFAAPSSTTLMIALLKEEVEVIQLDAQAALAGEPVSLALQEMINKVRAENHDVNEMSDLEIIIALVEAVNYL